MPNQDLITARLKLRRFRASDEEPFAAMNADPEVMRHFPAPLSRAESAALIGQIEAHFDQWGYGAWALERLDSGQLIGFCGLSHPTFEASFTPCVELAYRLAAAHWQQGFATEAARAALDVGFHRLGLTEIVAFTTVGNARSRAVMQRLRMRCDGEFDHPSLPPGHPLRRHVLYRARV